MKKGLLISISILLHTIGLAQIGKIEFQHLKDGLSYNYVRVITEDHQGFIWVGTEKGLNRYNGLDFKVFEPDITDSTSLPQGRIMDIFEDSKHQIWVSCYNGGLALFDRKTEKFKRFTHSNDANSLISNMLSCFFEDSEHKYWVGTDEGLDMLDPTTKIFTHYQYDATNPYSISNNSITDIIESKDGLLWISTRNGINIYDRKTNQFTQVNSSPNQYVGNEIYEVVEDQSGSIWAASLGQGVLQIKKAKDGSYCVTQYKHDPTNPNSISHNRVLSILEATDGNIWIGTENGGLNIYNPKTDKMTVYVNELDDENSISDNSIWEITQDSNDRIWIGTYGQGIDIVDSYYKKFNSVVEKPYSKGLNMKTVTSIIQNGNKAYIGTDGGGLNVWDRETNTFEYLQNNIRNKTSLSSNSILKLHQTKDSIIWIATWAGGLNAYNKTTHHFTRYLPIGGDSTSVSAENIFDIAEDSKGNLWLATFGGSVSMYNRKTGKFRNFLSDPNNQETISYVNILSIAIDQKDTVWIGTTMGVDKLWFDASNKIHILRLSNTPNAPEPFKNSEVHAIYIDTKNRVWCGFSTGLYLYENGKYRSIGEEVEGMGKLTNGIIEDEEHNFWISTNKGIRKLTFEKDSVNYTIQKFSKDDGLKSNSFTRHSFYRNKNNEYFIGGGNGFNYFTLEDVKRNLTPPKLYFTDFKLFNKRIYVGSKDSLLKDHISKTKKITLDYTQNTFTLDFIALSYTHASKNQYAYYMEGLENTWNYEGVNRSATYTGLNPGKYIFHMKASNNDGIWNEEGISIKITITPPFWQRWWFRALVAILVLGGAICFYKIRINRIQKQKEELEKIVLERTTDLRETNCRLVETQEEIMQQNEEIMAVNDQLEKQNQQIREQKEGLETKNEQINKQKNDLESKNEIITGSIRYAKTIQQAILPIADNIQNAFDHFLFFRPRDIVSGDFYWFTHENKAEPNEKYFIAAVDCTGHGVPGAFMSMIGTTLLNDIVRIEKHHDPGRILKELDNHISLSLKQKDTLNSDGMDVCLCVIQKLAHDQFKVEFAGAKRPLFYTQAGGEIVRLNSNKRGIGGRYRQSNDFETYELILSKGDMLYLTSDGYIDQNGINRKRLGTVRFLEILNEIKSNNLQSQLDILNQEIDTHALGEVQRDDMLIIGLKL